MINPPSNTATPPYYGEFRRRVMRGEIPVCYEISLEMNRIDELIKNPDFYYYGGPVEGFRAFSETELTKTDGSAISMLDTFKLWAEQLHGWYYIATKAEFVDGKLVEKPYFKRLVNKQYIILARGGAKSMYLSFNQSYFLSVSGLTTHQITTAPTMKQAEEVMSPIRTALTRAPGPLFKFLTTKSPYVKRFGSNMGVLMSPTKKGIENYLTSSLLEIRPMSINKLQGLRPMVSTVDEWLSGDLKEDPIGAIEQGASKLDDYIIVAASSEGTVRNGPGDSIKLELMKILRGDYYDPHTSIFYYKLDDIKEVAQPALWPKAQPNLGITVSYETYHRDVLRAEQAPVARNDILAKRFNIPTEGYTYFFTYEETRPHKKRSYRGMECALGADMSQGDDFCSFVFWFPVRDGSFGVKSLNFISERTLKLLPPAARVKYESFIKEGSLVVMDGSVLNMDNVYDIFEEEVVKREYHCLSFGYDPYNSEAFVARYKNDYGSFGVEAVRQGARTESVPLGDLKSLSEDRMILFDEDIMAFAMGNAMVLEDTNGNRKLYKRRYEAKIDPVAAMMDAYISYTRNLDQYM